MSREQERTAAVQVSPPAPDRTLALAHRHSAQFADARGRNIHVLQQSSVARGSGRILVPPSAYWTRIFARAWRETLEALRLESGVRVATTVGAPALATLIFAYVTGQFAWTGIATVGIVLSIGVGVFSAKATRLASATFREVEGQLHQVLSHLDEAEHMLRVDLIDRLVALYLDSTPDACAKIRTGLELPPVEWMNANLLELGEAWRVCSVRGVRYCIADYAGDPPSHSD
jgi:hypothetical protein